MVGGRCCRYRKKRLRGEVTAGDRGGLQIIPADARRVVVVKLVARVGAFAAVGLPIETTHGQKNTDRGYPLYEPGAPDVKVFLVRLKTYQMSEIRAA